MVLIQRQDGTLWTIPPDDIVYLARGIDFNGTEVYLHPDRGPSGRAFEKDIPEVLFLMSQTSPNAPSRPSKQRFLVSHSDAIAVDRDCVSFKSNGNSTKMQIFVAGMNGGFAEMSGEYRLSWENLKKQIVVLDEKPIFDRVQEGHKLQIAA